jgi:hypothetical protein
MEPKLAAPSRRMLSLAARTLTLLLAIGVMTVVGSEPASADPARDLQNVATGRCLESKPTREIYTLGCDGFSWQQWHVHAGSYASRVMNYTTGMCLDSNAAGRVYGNPCTANNRYQEWRLTANSVGWQFQNVATGRCLDSNTAGQVYTLLCNGGNFQRWG